MLRPSKNLKSAKKKAWDALSLYIRTSNADENEMVSCITCQVVKHYKEMHAGHYIDKGLGNGVYFYEKNIHPQCPRCNQFLDGAKDEYALWLIKKYGEGILDELNRVKNSITKYTIQDYDIMRKMYLDKVA